MKKLMRHHVIFALSLILLSCQASISQVMPTQKATTISPTQTQTVQVPETTVPLTSTPPGITPEAISADINFVPELMGSLFVGASTSGIYVEIDFDNDRVFRYQLPEGCELLSSRLKAVCEVDYISGKAGIYIYDVLTGEQDFTEERDVGRWDLTSSEQLLTYTLAGPEGVGISIYSYDFRANTSINIGTFNSKERELAVPWLSNSAQSMIGLNYEGLAWDDDDQWYMMTADSMEDEPIAVPPDIAATDSIEWSPNDNLVALVGFYRDDEDPHVGTLRCKRVVLIYDPIVKAVKSLVKVPEKRCFTPIDLYRDSIWSPDSLKLALVLNQQDICILHIAEDGSDCAPISNYYKTEYKVRSLVWSPDSKYVAYRGFDGRIQVYSLDDNKTYFIADTHNLSSSPIGSVLVWGQ